MKRIAYAVIALALACPVGLAAADEIPGLKASLKLKGEGRARKVVLRVEVPSSVRASLKKKSAKFKLNLYAGKEADATKRVKQYKWKLTRPMRKWSFKQKELCKKGYRHLRLKLKAKVRGKTYDEVTRKLELDC